MALMEIVSKPDMRTPEEAAAYVTQAAHDPALSRHLRRQHGEGHPARRRQRLGAQAGRATLGTRCEIKNVNSIRFIQQAIEYEARRQIEILEDGGKIDQETRLFDPRKGETRSMRSKEEAHDYRYFPDPDLLPLVLDAGLGRARSRPSLPELPDAKKARFVARVRPLGLRRRRAGRRAARRPTSSRRSPRAATPSWRPTG